MSFHGSKDHLFLVLNNIPLRGWTTVFSVHWRASWLLSGLGSDEYSCYKHLCADFRVDASFQLIWVNPKECGGWVGW